jgi:hypothetical protein
LFSVVKDPYRNHYDCPTLLKLIEIIYDPAKWDRFRKSPTSALTAADELQKISNGLDRRMTQEKANNAIEAVRVKMDFLHTESAAFLAEHEKIANEFKISFSK